MKHLFSLFTLFVMSLSVTAGDKVTLNDVMYGGYWPQTYAAIKPMADGEHFARMSDDRSLILKGSFKNGEIVDTLFNAATARGFEQNTSTATNSRPMSNLSCCRQRQRASTATLSLPSTTSTAARTTRWSHCRRTEHSRYQSSHPTAL